MIMNTVRNLISADHRGDGAGWLSELPWGDDALAGCSYVATFSGYAVAFSGSATAAGAEGAAGFLQKAVAFWKEVAFFLKIAIAAMLKAFTLPIAGLVFPAPVSTYPASDA